MTKKKSLPSRHDSARPGLWHEKESAWHEPFPGVHRRILASSRSGTVVYYKCRPGYAIPTHSHPHAQFGFCLAGSATLEIDKSKWKLEEGDCYYIPPGVPHAAFGRGSKNVSVIDIFVPERDELLSELLPADST